MRDLIEEIEAFCDRFGMSPTAFGVAAMNDKAFVHQLKGGRDLRVSTVERVRAFMDERQRSTQQTA